MADPLACMECRAWWSEHRGRVLMLVDINTAVDELMWAAIKDMGLGRFRRNRSDRREVIEGVLGRYHRDGHRLLAEAEYDQSFDEPEVVPGMR